MFIGVDVVLNGVIVGFALLSFTVVGRTVGVVNIISFALLSLTVIVIIFTLLSFTGVSVAVVITAGHVTVISDFGCGGGDMVEYRVKELVGCGFVKAGRCKEGLKFIRDGVCAVLGGQGCP